MKPQYVPYMTMHVIQIQRVLIRNMDLVLSDLMSELDSSLRVGFNVFACNKHTLLKIFLHSCNSSIA